MGRPKLRKQQRQEHVIALRVNREQFDLISVAAGRVGLPLASYARTAVLKLAANDKIGVGE